MGTFFSTEGRYNRARYFWSQFGILVLVYGATFGAGFARVLPTGQSATAIWYAILMVGNTLSALQIVKRLHDLDRSGTHYWLLLIPLYDLYLVLILLFKKGAGGPNRYGSDPLAGREEHSN
jgi:uncharacterized membrane protein YhaH (DUF805 family)